MSVSLIAAGAAAFAFQGIGLSTYSAGGYADSRVVELAEAAAAGGANQVVLSNIVLADLATGQLSEIVENGQRQTASLADVGRAIEVAKAQGLDVLLKPQVAVRDPAFDQYNGASWINMVNPDLVIQNPAAFFASYKAHLLKWAKLAEQHGVETLSIGNEMVAATKPQFTGYWTDIIDAVRGVYHGKLIYSALAPVMTEGMTNEITQIGFWDKLDLAGFDVYPTLTKSTNPSVAELAAGWRSAEIFGHQQDYVAFLNKMAAVVGKPVIFVETGLPSFDGASNRQATSDGDIATGRYADDMGEQADWWQAFFQVWAQNKPAWLEGVVVNNNDPGDLGAYWNQNYNVDGKPAEKVIAAWFGGATVINPGSGALQGGQAGDHLFLHGPRTGQAATQAASLTTTISVEVTGSIQNGAAPTIRAIVNGAERGSAALKALDSGFVDGRGVHFTANQTFTFELPGLVRIDQLQLGVEGASGANLFVHSAKVNGVAVASGATQWAGQSLTLDASAWNANLASRTFGRADNPFVVTGEGGRDVVHVLGSAGQYQLMKTAEGVRLTENAGLNQNALLKGIAEVAFADGAKVAVTDLRPGVTYAFGGAANDRLSATTGDSHLWGGAGDDLIQGGLAFDNTHGNMGRDTVYGGEGDDWVVGGQDNDLLHGDGGNDIVVGNLGADIMSGGSGNDRLHGGQANDMVFGQEGDDFISGDRGDDTLSGGAGADRFYSFGDAGLDRITDFDGAAGDRVVLDRGAAYTVAQVGADAVISIGGGAQVIVMGVQASSLSGWIVDL